MDYCTYIFSIPYPQYLHPSCPCSPPSRNSDPGSHSKLFPPHTQYGTCLVLSREWFSYFFPRRLDRKRMQSTSTRYKISSSKHSIVRASEGCTKKQKEHKGGFFSLLINRLTCLVFVFYRSLCSLRPLRTKRAGWGAVGLLPRKCTPILWWTVS